MLVAMVFVVVQYDIGSCVVCCHTGWGAVFGNGYTECYLGFVVDFFVGQEITVHQIQLDVFKTGISFCPR
jgi:hypothetical protein